MYTCNECKDTHKVWSARDERTVMCMSCPLPCGMCLGKGRSAYCLETPCKCTCHLKKGEAKMEAKLWSKPHLNKWGVDERADEYGNVFIRIIDKSGDNFELYTFAYVPAYGRGIVIGTDCFSKERAMAEADRVWETLPVWNPR
jgi:hypothetical protein